MGQLRTRLKNHAPPLAVIIFALCGAAGCLIPTRVAELDLKIPREATPVAIQSGIEKMDDPATQRRIQAMMARPEMRAVQRELVAGLVDGTVETLGEKERAARIEALVSRAMAGVLRQASQELPPMAEATTRKAVTGALDEALAPERQQKLVTTVHALVATSVRGAAEGLRDGELGKTISTAMTDEIGPALQKSVRDNVAPSAAEVLKNEELRRELGATMRVLGKEMVIGATEALSEQKDPEDDSMLSRVAALTRQGAKLFGSAAWLLVLVIIALIVWVVKLIAQARQYRADADRQAVTLRLLEEVSRASRGKPWSEEVMDTVRQSLHDAEELAAAERKAKRRGRRDPARDAARDTLPISVRPQKLAR